MASSFEANPASHQGQARQGNLQSLLSSYDGAPPPPAQPSDNSSVSASEAEAGDVASASASAAHQQPNQLDFRGRSDTLGSLGGMIDFRDRSSTLGSAADVVADCLGPFVVDPSPPLQPVQHAAQVPVPAHISSAAAPAGAPAASGAAAPAAPPAPGPVAGPPAFPGMHHINYGAGLPMQQQQEEQKQQNRQQNNQQHQQQQQLAKSGSSHGSASGFLSGSFGTATQNQHQQASGGGGHLHQQQPQQQQHKQNAIPGAAGIQVDQHPHHHHQQQKQQVVAHTPPSALGPASYEARHFGKRMRAGSISGRLRSASDLEDRGIIDRAQKGILKDLIISGDDALQSALDRYEDGDATELEAMIKSGHLQAFQANQSASGGAGGAAAAADGVGSHSNIDILGDLDLDFLTVGDDFGELGGDGDVHVDAVGSGVGVGVSVGGGPQHQHQHHDDGIGDLEFNGEYVGTEEELTLPSAEGHAPTPPQQRGQPGTTVSRSHPGAPPQVGAQDGAGGGRWRANSLAFGGLLDEHAAAEGGAEAEGAQQQHSNFANWMDNPRVGGAEQRRGGGGTPSSNIVGANGGLYIISSKGGGETDEQQLSPESEIKVTAGALNKLEQAAERKRERELKKEAREREKLDRREKRERESREKKEREAREKRERREKKEAAARARREEKSRRRSLSPRRDSKAESSGQDGQLGSDDEGERKETPSGLGLPRSMSDPNLTVGLDSDGLLQIDAPDGWVGAYSPDSRKIRIERFLAKRNHRVWTKKVKYDVRKNFADSRLRVKGRFVKKEDELLMRDLMSLT